MKNLKRCPFCHGLPNIHLDPHGQYQGGCQTGEEELCKSLRDVIYQPRLDYAQSQWNHIVGMLEMLLAKAA